MDFGKNFFLERVAKPWSRLPREEGESPIPGVLKRCVDEILMDKG